MQDSDTDGSTPSTPPSLAGRALRALRAQQSAVDAPAEAPALDSLADAPVDAAPVTEAPVDEAPVDEAPVASAAEAPTVPVSSVDLAKQPAVAESPAAEPVPDVAVAPEPFDVTPPAAEPSRRSPLLLAAVLVVVVALAFAVIGLVVYLRGTSTPANGRAEARDAALTAARIDIATLTSLDYKHAADGLKKWLAVTTGDFHDNIAADTKSGVEVIEQAKQTTVGTVLAAAITELDQDAGTATAIASVSVISTPAGGKSAQARNRYTASLKNVDGVWKIANLAQVQVTLS